jgi:hypothetical protein
MDVPIVPFAPLAAAAPGTPLAAVNWSAGAAILKRMGSWLMLTVASRIMEPSAACETPCGTCAACCCAVARCLPPPLCGAQAARPTSDANANPYMVFFFDAEVLESINQTVHSTLGLEIKICCLKRQKNEVNGQEV